MMKQNILIVDDHRENLVALEAILEAPERNLITASSGNEALDIALKQDLALILLDVQMPEMDGFEVAELLRKNRRTRAIPVIFVTAISKEEKYVTRGYECGAVDYLFKPIDQQVLEAKVNVFLELDMEKRKLQQAVVQMKRLKDENERLLQALGEGVIGTDTEGRVTFCNDAATALLERDLRIEQDRVEDLLFFDREGNKRWNWTQSPVYERTREGEAWRSGTPFYVSVSEGQRALEGSANPINQPGEAFSGVVLVLRDVTGRETDPEELQRREARRYPRKKMTREMVVFNRETGGNVGRLLNISVDGFKLFARSPLEEGQELALGMVLPEPIAGVNTMSFDARTIWCEEQERGGEYHAGFQFLEPGETNRNIIETLIERF
jgi:CheY-like chemotaxis protein